MTCHVPQLYVVYRGAALAGSPTHEARTRRVVWMLYCPSRRQGPASVLVVCKFMHGGLRHGATVERNIPGGGPTDDVEL